MPTDDIQSNTRVTVPTGTEIKEANLWDSMRTQKYSTISWTPVVSEKGSSHTPGLKADCASTELADMCEVTCNWDAWRKNHGDPRTLRKAAQNRKYSPNGAFKEWKKKEETATKEDNWDAVSHLQRHTATNKTGISNCAGRSRRTRAVSKSTCYKCCLKSDSSPSVQ